MPEINETREIAPCPVCGAPRVEAYQVRSNEQLDWVADDHDIQTGRGIDLRPCVMYMRAQLEVLNARLGGLVG